MQTEKKNTGAHAILEVEGPDISKDVVSRLGIALCESFQAESGYEDCHSVVVYHVNDKDHVCTKEGLLSEKMGAVSLIRKAHEWLTEQIGCFHGVSK